MNRKHLRKSLMGGALVLALAGAALGARTPDRQGPAPASTDAPRQVAPFELAGLLSQSSPNVVIIRLDDTEPRMIGSLPASAFGADDEALVKAAPKAREIVLVGSDPVRVDRVARKLLASGRHVEVLEGGSQAWTQAMGKDPAAPKAGATPEEWTQYRKNVALRRYFGDESTAPPPVVKAPAPVMAAPAPPKKREGC